MIFNFGNLLLVAAISVAGMAVALPLGAGLALVIGAGVSGGRAKAPDGQTELVIGHEMFGEVADVGSSVTRVKPGDYAVFTVRRGCGECACCLMNRADMCQTGKYCERGIRGLDGYQTEYAVDQQYVVRVPVELQPVGVLMEPLSVVEKAIDEPCAYRSCAAPTPPRHPIGFTVEAAWLPG